MLSNIEDGAGNPNLGAADSSGPKFIAAGDPFSATVTAFDAEGDVTPNYGQESIPETVRLSANLANPVDYRLVNWPASWVSLPQPCHFT